MKKEFLKRILPPLKGKVKNNFNIFGFDVETKHIKDDFLRKNGKVTTCYRQEFVMGSVVGDNDTKEVFFNRKEMCEYLLSRKLRDSLILATNLEFDFDMLFYDNYANFLPPIYRNKLLGMTHLEKGKRKYYWRFYDTLNYIQCSLAQLGEIVGMPKLSTPKCMEINPDFEISMIAREPKNNIERNELIKYNLNDSEITYKFGVMFKDFCTKHNMKMKMTIGSVGMDFWRRNHQKFTLKRERDNICELHFEGAMRGGMTQIFKRGTYNKKLWYYDYRSSYPARMRDGVDNKGSYPDPSSSIYIENSRNEDIEKYEGIVRADIKAPYSYMPLLGLKSNEGKLIFPYGEFSGWFTNYELRIAMKNGYEIEPHEMVAYTSLFKPFREAVLYLYDLRKKYKKDNHPFQAMVKTLMNSGLFGKWATNFLNMDEMTSLDSITFNKIGKAFKDGKEIKDYKINEVSNLGSGFVSTKKQCKPFRYSMPILSSYTTMLGRVKMWEDLHNIASKYLAYGDTDSAILTAPVLKEGFELGDWELESTPKGGIFMKPKQYALFLDNKILIKAKGSGRAITQDNLYNVIENQNVTTERFSKLRESSRIGIKSGSVIIVKKMFSLEDNKRDWSKPFDLNDWQDSEPLCLKSNEVKEKILNTSPTLTHSQWNV